MNKSKVQVYDWPTRLFHALFAGLFVVAFFIATTFDDESLLYPYHMMAGLVLALTVVLRILWGIFGTNYARFSSFMLNPKDLINYFKDIITAKNRPYLGHNPASSWAAVVMMALALGLAITGYFMVQGKNESLEDVHELLANAFLVVAIGHVAGIILHSLRHKDAIGLSMIHGKKISTEESKGIKKNYPIVGFLFVLITSSFVVHLYKNYDQSTQNLKLFGNTYQLGETEKDQGEGKDKNHEDKNEDHDEDHDDD